MRWRFLFLALMLALTRVAHAQFLSPGERSKPHNLGVLSTTRLGVGVAQPVTGFQASGPLYSVAWSDGNARNTAAYFSNSFDETLLTANLSGIFGVDDTFTATTNTAKSVNAALYQFSLGGTHNYSGTNAALRGLISANGSGTYTLLMGARPAVSSLTGATGPITAATGVRSEFQWNGTGTITTAYLYDTFSSTAAVAVTATDTVGYHVSAPTKGATSTYTTVEGVVIEDESVGATNIGFRQKGTNEHNRLQGNTMIGLDSAPTGVFTVSTQSQHFHLTQSTAPTVSAGGCSSPAITTGSTDEAGEVSVGSSCTVAKTITVAFHTSFTNAPLCTANFSSGATVQAVEVGPATGSLVLTVPAAFASSDKLQWICIGRE